jgi:hypothetical protein
MSRADIVLWRAARSGTIAKEVFQTGRSSRLDSLSENLRNNAVLQLKQVFNVGARFAATLVGKGILSIRELEEQARAHSMNHATHATCAPLPDAWHLVC